MPGAGTSSSATLNQQLTDFAAGHMNDISQAYAYAERLCPTVQVPGTHGQYKKFDDVDSFQTYTTARALGADPTRIAFATEDLFYNCTPQALEVTVDEEERRQAGPDNAVSLQLLDEGKIKALLNASALSFALARTNYVIANTTPVAGRGNFSNPNIDPIDQLDEQIDQLLLDCGGAGSPMITLDLGSWRAIRSHPLVKKRLTGVQVSEISVNQLMTMLVVPCDVMVATISFTGTNKGPVGGTGAAAGEQTGKKRLLAGNILIHLGVPNPTVYDPSPFKTFTVGDHGVKSVRSYMAPNGLYGGHIVDWSECLRQTSTLAMRRLQLS